jgi:hypothetical protein
MATMFEEAGFNEHARMHSPRRVLPSRVIALAGTLFAELRSKMGAAVFDVFDDPAIIISG